MTMEKWDPFSWNSSSTEVPNRRRNVPSKTLTKITIWRWLSDYRDGA